MQGLVYNYPSDEKLVSICSPARFQHDRKLSWETRTYLPSSPLFCWHRKGLRGDLHPLVYLHQRRPTLTQVLRTASGWQRHQTVNCFTHKMALLHFLFISDINKPAIDKKNMAVMKVLFCFTMPVAVEVVVIVVVVVLVVVNINVL